MRKIDEVRGIMKDQSCFRNLRLESVPVLGSGTVVIKKTDAVLPSGSAQCIGGKY